jgi:hypothetical protein
MDIFSRDSLAELAGVRSDRSVSIFLPTHRHGPDSRPFAMEDLIRWKNLVREADARLRTAETPARDVDQLLAPARALTEDSVFWQFQGDGLAAFAAPGLFRTFRVPTRLDELVVVAPRFHVKPLLPLLVGDGRFYVLALSQNEVRLIEATRDTAGEVDLVTAPGSLQEALRYDDPERQLQYHTASPHAGGRRAAVFHGHGVGTDDRKDNVLRFCQQVDRGLAPMLRGRSVPLVLAAVESVAVIYRQANTYRHLLETLVPGNPEGISSSNLHGRAWPLVEPVMRRTREAAAARYHASRGTAKVTDDLVEALRAAAEGRMDVLFVPVGVQRWGTYDDGAQQAVVRRSPKPGDEDLLNDVAVRTILSGGTVYAVPPDEVPDGGVLAGLFRY